MKRNWLTRTLVVLMTLAMVAGVLAINPKTAHAAITASVVGDADLKVGGEYTYELSFTKNTANNYTYSWTYDGAYFEPVGATDGSSIKLKVKNVTNTPQTVSGTVTSSDATEGEGTGSKTGITIHPFDVDDVNLTVGGSAKEPTATYGGIYSLSSADSTIAEVQGTTLVGKKVGDVDITATSNNGSQTAIFTARVTAGDPQLKLSTGNTSVEKNNSITVTATWRGSGTVAWTPSNGNITVSSATTGTNSSTVTVTGVATGGTAPTLTATLSPVSDYAGDSKAITISVIDVVTVNVNKSSLTIPLNSSDSTLTASVTNSSGSTYYSTLQASSSNTNIVSVQSINASTGAITLAAGNTTGTATITIGSSDSSSSRWKKVTVTSGNPTPTIKAYFDPDNYNLNKSTGYITLHIEVTNPKSNYVTIKRSNIRTYATGYDTHESTYYYTHYLDGDGHARIEVHPQYNGTTYYTVSATGASSVQTHNLTISGYTTMPQTGPDYTWVYILSGLCVAALAAAVTLNARKKKHQEN